MSARQPARRPGLLAAAAILSVTGLSVTGCSGEQEQSTAQESSIGGPFKLVDTNGKTVTDETLKGKPYAIFFGFTRCPDVCPTTMSRMAQLHQKLGKDADKFNILFVSVDPEHDKPADIAGFLSLFPIPVIGLTGSEDALKQIEKAFRVYVAHVPLPDGDYSIDHTALIYLMDGKGRFVEPMSASGTVDDNLKQLRKLIDS